MSAALILPRGCFGARRLGCANARKLVRPAVRVSQCRGVGPWLYRVCYASATTMATIRPDHAQYTPSTPPQIIACMILTHSLARSATRLATRARGAGAWLMAVAQYASSSRARSGRVKPGAVGPNRCRPDAAPRLAARGPRRRPPLIVQRCADHSKLKCQIRNKVRLSFLSGIIKSAPARAIKKCSCKGCSRACGTTRRRG